MTEEQKERLRGMAAVAFTEIITDVYGHIFELDEAKKKLTGKQLTAQEEFSLVMNVIETIVANTFFRTRISLTSMQESMQRATTEAATKLVDGDYIEDKAKDPDFKSADLERILKESKK